MTNLHYSTQINAPREKVWDVMLDDATYREWTAAFMPGSHYQGDWSEGSKMLFLGPAAEGEKEGGMAAVVHENRPHEYISLKYHAEIRDGVEVPMEGEGFENYTLEDKDGGTEVSIDLINLPDEYADMFNEAWPKALEKLKELAEK
ncbi:MAG: SRPBCC domain-containing protein [Patescibacteria group bacterium]